MKIYLSVGIAVVVVALVFLVKSCQSEGTGPGTTSSTTGPGPTGLMVEARELQPDALESGLATLVYGFDIPVKMVVTKNGDEILVDLVAYGESMETEIYEYKEGRTFSLKEAALESYSPPLPLLEFPVELGARHEWKGKILTADPQGGEPSVIHDGKAEIITERSSVKMPDKSEQDAVLVTVNLLYDSGTPTPAERKLRFWFVKGKGLVKREFGSGAERIPRAEN